MAALASAPSLCDRRDARLKPGERYPDMSRLLLRGSPRPLLLRWRPRLLPPNRGLVGIVGLVGKPELVTELMSVMAEDWTELSGSAAWKLSCASSVNSRASSNFSKSTASLSLLSASASALSASRTCKSRMYLSALTMAARATPVDQESWVLSSAALKSHVPFGNRTDTMPPTLKPETDPTVPFGTSSSESFQITLSPTARPL
mmetsp:Transcript_45157/g.114520  ORF Transcript_45157/g.114520 Transcript_45157/m.114520 type:complete len:203 (+) Transcript_45157:896-1504(+)